MTPARNSFDDAPLSLGVRAFAPLSIVVGSLMTILPFVATFPILPPFGLMMLLGWRLHRPDALRIWAPLPLGLFDDLVSGQPLGSAIVLWMTCFFVIDLIERRVMYRDFWQDWLIAAGGIGFCLIAGRLFASPFGAHVDTVLLVQIAVSILLFPVVAGLCARLDARRAQP